MTWVKPELTELIDELQEGVLDEAEAKIRQAVRDQDWHRTDRAAMFVLGHFVPARARGRAPPRR
jgi:hypothetical protein